MGLTVDTTGFTTEEAKLALEAIHLDAQAAEARATTEHWRRVRDHAARMVRVARAREKIIAGRAYRTGYRLEKMIGREEGYERGRRILAKDDRCLPMTDDERGRFAKREAA